MATRTRRVIWTQSAREALEEVLDYIARDSASGAIRVLERTLATAESLSLFPERGRVVPEIDDPALRETFVYGYRLLYRLHADRIVVCAFIHGARDFTSWRKKEGPNI